MLFKGDGHRENSVFGSCADITITNDGGGKPTPKPTPKPAGGGDAQAYSQVQKDIDSLTSDLQRASLNQQQNQTVTGNLTKIITGLQ